MRAADRARPVVTCRPPRAGGIVALALALGACSALPGRVGPDDGVGVCGGDSTESAPRFTATAYDTGLPAQGQWRDGFDLADMNGDGLLDLLHGAARKSARREPTIFLGDGRGGFRRWREAHYPPLPYDYGDAKAADFNGDGHMDFALGVHLRGVVALLNEGGGHFAPWGEGLGLRDPAEAPDEPIFASRSLALGDVDGDARVDIVALNEGPALFAPQRRTTEALRVHFNRDRVWQWAPFAPGVTGFGDSVAIGDIDGDGRADLAFGTQIDGERRLLVRGANAPQAETLQGLPDAGTVTAVAMRNTGRERDGGLMLATRSIVADDFCIALMQWRPAAGIATRFWSEASRDPIAALAAGDIDGDGRDEVIAARSSGAMRVFAATRRGLVADVEIPAPPAMAGCHLYDLKLADLDSDGRLEAIAGFAGDDPGFDGRGCPSGGALLGWRLRGP